MFATLLEIMLIYANIVFIINRFDPEPIIETTRTLRQFCSVRVLMTLLTPRSVLEVREEGKSGSRFRNGRNCRGVRVVTI
jgi:hypothetical protein